MPSVFAATRDLTHGLTTFSGRVVFPLDPDPGDISIVDIAHALSLTCRFNGHTTRFYSVASHSVYVSFAVPEEDALWALLHDASEAYLCDIPRPVKYTDAFAPYRQAEQLLQATICQAFGLDEFMPESVKTADDLLLAAEIRDLMPALATDEWRKKAGAWPLVVPKSPERAKEEFLDRYNKLTKVRAGI